MDNFFSILSNFIRKIGDGSAWLNVVLMVLICVDVTQRYLFNHSYNWMLELEWHIFGLIFLFGSAVCLQEDKHVRVDLFYNNFSPKKQAKVNLIGHSLLLLPWCAMVMITGYNYASNSLYINESSPNPGGLPAMYVIKFCIVIGFGLLFLQGVVLIYDNIKTMIK